MGYIKTFKQFVNEMIVAPIRLGRMSSWTYPLDFSDFTTGDLIEYIDRKWEVINIQKKSITIKAKNWDNREYTLKSTTGIYPVKIKKFGGHDRP